MLWQAWQTSLVWPRSVCDSVYCVTACVAVHVTAHLAVRVRAYVAVYVTVYVTAYVTSYVTNRTNLCQGGGGRGRAGHLQNSECWPKYILHPGCDLLWFAKGTIEWQMDNWVYISFNDCFHVRWCQGSLELSRQLNTGILIADKTITYKVVQIHWPI